MTTAPDHGQFPYDFTIADRMRKAREVAGLEQAELADRMGAHRGTISNYENGKTNPRKMYVLAWAHHTGAPYHWLMFGHTENPHPDKPDGGCSLCAARDSNPEPADSSDCAPPFVLFPAAELDDEAA